MIIEGKHSELGRGVFVSDIQEGSAAENAGLNVGDMILCVNQIDLIGADYDTVSDTCLVDFPVCSQLLSQTAFYFNEHC